MSYDDGSFGFDNLNVVSVFPGKVNDNNHIGSILIFVNYSLVVSSITGSKFYIYNSNNKNYTSIKSVNVAYPVEILYI